MGRVQCGCGGCGGGPSKNFSPGSVYSGHLVGMSTFRVFFTNNTFFLDPTKLFVLFYKRKQKNFLFIIIKINFFLILLLFLGVSSESYNKI